MSSNIGLVVNPKSGFVGIGTGRPSTLLHVDGNMLAAGTITASNLSILGDFVTLNTITSNTEQMVIQNAGTGPALKVTQTGAHPIADFYDDGQALAMRIADGGNVGIGTATPTSKLHVNGDVTITSTGALIIPRGTTAQRPTNPAAGMMRYNNDEGYIETYEAILSTWIPISTYISVLATGGTVTEIVISGIQYRVHTFTTEGFGSFQVLRGGQVEYLVVGGGGSGGSRHGGGGGAGGVFVGSLNVTIQSYTIQVGAGGVGTTSTTIGNNGNSSSVFGITALGGGRGGTFQAAINSTSAGGSGASGGGGAGLSGTGTNAGGSGTSGQGNPGGIGIGPNPPITAGGGGGAGSIGQNAVGNNAGNGGAGTLVNIDGNSFYYAGGGGGGGYYAAEAAGNGGSGGGGGGGNNNGTVGAGGGSARNVGSSGLKSGGNGGNGNNGGNGGANTGSGGGGAGQNADVPATTTTFGGTGGSGIVIIRYRIL